MWSTPILKAESQPGSVYQPNRSLRARYSFSPILSFGRSALVLHSCDCSMCHCFAQSCLIKNNFYMVAQKSPKTAWIGGFLLSLVSFSLSHDCVRSSEASSYRMA